MKEDGLPGACRLQAAGGTAGWAWKLLRRFARRYRTQEWPGERLPELYDDLRSLDLEALKRSSLHAKCAGVDRRVALVTSASFDETDFHLMEAHRIQRRRIPGHGR
jgi:hypothetical protein